MTEPRSALNLRTVLAAFGLIACTALGVVAVAVGSGVAAALLFAGAIVAVIDLVLIARRKKREPGEHTTLFE
jgi:hypothetical protein